MWIYQLTSAWNFILADAARVKYAKDYHSTLLNAMSEHMSDIQIS